MPKKVDLEKYKTSSSIKNIAGDLEKKHKTASIENIVSGLIQKHDLQNEKNIGQNEMLNILEKEKSNEKDENIIANYDLIIDIIKKFFAKKNDIEFKKTFDLKKAQEIIKNKLNEVAILQEVQIFAKKYEEKADSLKKFAGQIIGKNFVNELDNKYKITKQAQEKFYGNCVSL